LRLFDLFFYTFTGLIVRCYKMTDSAVFLVVLITAVVLVGAALLIAMWLAPRSNNALKGEVYECGRPTRGTSWMQIRVG
jgi:NADH-quinone oxidoreductase subunit A